MGGWVVVVSLPVYQSQNPVDKYAGPFGPLECGQCNANKTFSICKKDSDPKKPF